MCELCSTVVNIKVKLAKFGKKVSFNLFEQTKFYNTSFAYSKTSAWFLILLFIIGIDVGRLRTFVTKCYITH